MEIFDNLNIRLFLICMSLSSVSLLKDYHMDGATDLSSRYGQQEDTILCKYVLVYFTLKT